VALVLPMLQARQKMICAAVGWFGTGRFVSCCEIPRAAVYG
jgi:hypothetical protein